MPEPAEPRTMRPLDVPRDLVTLAEDAILDAVRIRLGRSALANYAPGEPIPLSGSEAETAARVVLAAVYPEIERQVRAKVAAEARTFADQFGAARSKAMASDAATLRWFADRVTASDPVARGGA